jgi:hypothetical protein
MKKLTNLFFIYTSLTLFCLFAFGYNNCRAEIAPVHPSKDYSEIDWAAIQLQLESQSIQQTLSDYGMTTSDINSLFSQLSQQDIHKLALNIHQVVPAGDSVAIIVGILIIVILVIVILKLMNKEIIVR